jgi:hypothetical protein
MARTREDVEKKVLKLPGGEEFATTVVHLTVQQLEARITQMQKDLDESEEHKENNEALKEARDVVTNLVGPYNDVKKAIKLKTQYIIALIHEKGKE